MPSEVVLTRTDDRLASLLAARGATVLTVACVAIEPADGLQLAAVLSGLDVDDMLVLTSPAGVDAVAGAIALDALRCGIAAVGAVTAARIATHGRTADFIPTHPSGASLAREMPLPRGEIVLARSDRALADLPAILRRRGARVRELVAYRTVPRAGGDVASARRAIARGATVVFASPSAIEGLLEAIGAVALRDARVVAIGATTADAVRTIVGRAPLVAAVAKPEEAVDVVIGQQRVAHR